MSIWTGRLDQAARWLDACEQRRPDDQPVWLARLALATANRDVEAAERAIGHLQSRWFLPSEVLRLRAWLASFGRDRQSERQSLLALAAEEPGNAGAWARLAELAVVEKHLDQAETFRLKQKNASALRARYSILITGDDPAHHAAELRRLARDLGRRIEERGWALIEQGRAATEPLWSPEQVQARSRPPSQTLASLLGEPPVLSRDHLAETLAGAPSIMPAFRDDAQESGLRFFHDNGQTAGPVPPPVTMCGGVALLDYDRDGWIDVYAVQAGPFPPTDWTSLRGGSSVPEPGRRHVRGRDREIGHRRYSRAAMAMASLSAISTTTAIPTFSSPAGDPTPSTATGATGRSRTSPRGGPGRRSRLADLGGLRRPRRRRRPRPLCLPLPAGTQTIPGMCGRPGMPAATSACPLDSPPCPTTSSATTRAGSWT